MDSLPIDLIRDIFSRLPAKSIGRSRCVSRQWESILCRQDFTELFLTRSSARPRLFFAFKGYQKWHFFSSPQPHSPHDRSSSSLVVEADSHSQLKLPGGMRLDFCSRAYGLFCFRLVSNQYVDTVQHVICNPTTGQYTILPKLRTNRQRWYSFLGFDPIDKQFKVLLCMAELSFECDYRILTLETGKMCWRKIKPPLTHHPAADSSQGICIDGVLYYFAQEYKNPCLKKFMFINAPLSIYEWDVIKLINYKGKLAVISGLRNSTTGSDERPILEFFVWVLEYYEFQEWSQYAYTFPDHNFIDRYNVFVVGVTTKGEINFSKKYGRTPDYVFYFNPESNTLRSVEIQVNHEVLDHRSYTRDGASTFVDHVEDLNFDMRAHLLQDRLRFESINKFDALSLLDYD
ncbi:hypothetical protein EUTSA_v10009883mg [Eutrema salsugineum]|uniref:F-box domain-containing protein n=1 Tax=Eutrema salsugineum TaxID=72664 RepID=V4L1E4_EUTSA|nr:hypothetical protein EUTSA_v10009883mg [Eutrema salsugineum]